MKRTGYLLLAALAALFLSACVGDLDPDFSGKIEKDSIVLRLGSAPLTAVTKADTERGINYNENLIESVDLFFYPNGGTGQNAVLSAFGRSVTAEVEGDSTVFYVSVHYTEVQAAALFGSQTSGTCQVYVVANSGLSYGSNTSVDAVKAQLVERDFASTPIQSSFVMSSDGTATVTQATSAGEPYAFGRVRMRRAAAKAQLFLRIMPEIPDGTYDNVVWRPDLDGTHHSDGVTVSLVNISKKGRIDAPYTPQSADYASIEGRSIVARNTLPTFSPPIDASYNEYIYATLPFYSYPISWSDIDEHACNYLIRVPWYSVTDDGAGGTIESDRSEYRTYQVSANVLGLEFERNHCYRTFVYIQSLGGADADKLVTIPNCDFYICDWNTATTDTGTGEVAGTFDDYKYLVIDNPSDTLNNEEVARYTYVSSSAISSVTVTKVVYYDNTNRNGPRQTLVTGDPNFAAAAAKITPSFSTAGLVTLRHSLDDALGRHSRWEVWATVTNADGISEEVHFLQNPSIRLECYYETTSTKVGNVFVDGFFARVKDATFGTEYTDSHAHGGVTYWSGNYWWSGSGTRGNHYSVGTVNGNNYTTYGSISAGKENNENPIFTTEINLSSFNSDDGTYQCRIDGTVYTFEYRIGDPRRSASSIYPGWSLFPYLSDKTGNTYTTTAWEDPEKIMITVQNGDEQNFIAPRFLISSNLNGQGTKANSFENTVKRAAVYQEAGYPAGRWRLPTEAEMAFIYARVNEGTVPELFGGSSGYYVASGKHLTVQAGDPVIRLSSTVSGTPSARFVYDLWYWGDEQETTNEYHANGHDH